MEGEYSHLPVRVIADMFSHTLTLTSLSLSLRQVEADHRETAATIMAFFLSFGLLIGSSSSFIWTHLVTVKP